MATTQIGTESKRASLHQNVIDLYNGFKVGGAYNAKAIVTDGSFADLITSTSGKNNCINAGFKTLMAEQATQMKMGLDNTIVTTRYRTSVYGDLDTTKYSP